MQGAEAQRAQVKCRGLDDVCEKSIQIEVVYLVEGMVIGRNTIRPYSENRGDPIKDPQ